MEEDGEKRYGEEVDWISNLPDSLKFEILLKLDTKEVVKTSVLSSSWRSLWRYVPGLELNFNKFPNPGSFVSFVDSFLKFNNESRLQNFKLLYGKGLDGAHLTEWINTVVERKVEHLSLDDWYTKEAKMPLTLYTCESLVSLRLCGRGLKLASPKFVYLPSLKVMELARVRFTDELALEKLISGSPILERLYIENGGDSNEVLRVCSPSLLSFSYVAYVLYMKITRDLLVVKNLVIDAPRLEFLRVNALPFASFELKNIASLVKADIGKAHNFFPNDVRERNVVGNFLLGISSVKDLIITSNTLEVINNYSRCETLPLFRNISSLHVKFYDYNWEMLPIFLGSCPSLKSLVVELISHRMKERYLTKQGISSVSGPRCLLKSLEYVEIKGIIKGEVIMVMKLVAYLLENSDILKKLTLCLDDSIKKDNSAILKELLTIQRISTCQVVVL